MSFSNADTGSKEADPYKSKNIDTPSLKEKVEDLNTFIDACKFGMMTTRDGKTGALVSRCMAVAAKVCLFSFPLSICISVQYQQCVWIVIQYRNIPPFVGKIQIQSTREIASSFGTATNHQKQENGGVTLLFHTNTESGKTDDLSTDSHINISFLNSSGEWASVSGMFYTPPFPPFNQFPLHNPSFIYPLFPQQPSTNLNPSGLATIETDRETIKKYYSPTLKTWLGDLGDGTHDGGPNDPRIGVIKVEAKTATYAIVRKNFLARGAEIAQGVVTGKAASVNKLREISESEIQTWRTSQGMVQ